MDVFYVLKSCNSILTRLDFDWATGAPGLFSFLDILLKICYCHYDYGPTAWPSFS